MGSFIRDLRYAIRVLLRRRGYTFAAVVALALGIGASTAIFSVLYAVLWRPLSYPDADRLTIVWEADRLDKDDKNVVNPANYADWNEQNKVFQGMAGFVDSLSNLTGNGQPEEVSGQWVTPNFFSVLGGKPFLGRTFADKEPDWDLAVLSYGLWQRRFGGDSGIIGQKILINGKPATVIGVMPASFHWYIKKSSFFKKVPEMWKPFPITQEERTRKGRFLGVVARLKPGISVEKAQAEMTLIGNRLEKEYPEFNTNWGVNVVPLRQQLSGDVRPALLILSGAVGFVLLIACTNVANLMLTRAVAGTREIAVRCALGASPFQIVRQLLSESLVLAMFGGGAGLLLAFWGLDALNSLGSQYGIDFQSVHISSIVLFFTIGISALTGILFGLVPAIAASRWNVQEHLRETAKGASVKKARTRDALIVSEIALALVLLTGAGLLIQSFWRLLSVNPGFNARNVLTFRMLLPSAKYPDDLQKSAFFKNVGEKIEALPGVTSAGLINFLPFTGPAAGTIFAIMGNPKPAFGEEPGTEVFVTSTSFFRTMQIPLMKGRWFNSGEETEARRVMLINDAMSRRYFPNEDPIGKQLKVEMRDEPNAPTTIIGVVRDVKNTSLDSEVEPAVYWPQPELPYSFMTIVVRTQQDPRTLIPAVQKLIHSMDPDQPIARVRTMEELLGDSTVQAEFNMILMAILAGVALALALVGIYGVMSYAVLQRVQEIGVRMALGASSRDVLRLVLKQGGLLILIGSFIGIIASLVLTRLMKSLLFEVSTTDATTYAAVTGFLVLIALLACLIPARRAASVDPLIALRAE